MAVRQAVRVARLVALVAVAAALLAALLAVDAASPVARVAVDVALPTTLRATKLLSLVSSWGGLPVAVRQAVWHG